jgi:hypothetical protein
LYGYSILKAKSFYPALTQTSGAWVLENGFSIETGDGI